MFAAEAALRSKLAGALGKQDPPSSSVAHRYCLAGPRPRDEAPRRSGGRPQRSYRAVDSDARSAVATGLRVPSTVARPLACHDRQALSLALRGSTRSIPIAVVEVCLHGA